MTILVTGATGMVGANLVRLLLEQGEGPLRVLVRRGANRLALEGLPVEIAEGDVEDEASTAAAVKGCAVVFHAAGLADVGGAPVERLWAVNVRGTENVCRAALAAGVEKLVHTSSAAAVDAAPPGALADEETRTGVLGRGAQPYARSKKEAEAVVLRYVARGLPAVIVNPSLMFGAWDVKPTSGKTIVVAARRWVPFYPVGGANVLDVRDAVAGHVAAWRHGAVGERYILGCRNLTYRELLRIIHAAVGRRPPVVPLWPAPARLAARLARPFAAHLPPVARELTSPDAVDAVSRTHHVSAAKAIRVLALPQTPVEEAVGRAHAWLRDHGYLNGEGR
ncbi:MAG TPA: NAD-dependent epimerase/dehydratase family protein [Myxococcota bacterium]|jgi:dihydroflavonol-4-reductase|nr:NAD-dependent epimerase/dehydratase family protein [Myxococcota bacterium]